MKSVVFRIRKPYFEAILAGEKTVEYRAATPFWFARFIHEPVDVAVFVCGRRVHRRRILGVELIRTPSDFSDQGKADVWTELCFAIHLGDVVGGENHE